MSAEMADGRSNRTLPVYGSPSDEELPREAVAPLRLQLLLSAYSAGNLAAKCTAFGLRAWERALLSFLSPSMRRISSLGAFSRS
jgi:hypothetical protein